MYKVLPLTYARRLVEKGELRWSTLAWFQNLEEIGRGDNCEGRRTYFPVNGLEVNRLERGGLSDSAQMLLRGHGLVSRAAQSHHILIYSLTLDATLKIGDPADRGCVEMFDPPQFVRRVRDALGRDRRARIDTFIHHTVQYWSPTNPPQEVWAFPDKLTMHKRKDEYGYQKEYRLAFGTRTDVFDFENVECFIVNEDTGWPSTTLDEQAHTFKVRVGALDGCCRML
jgi:hypothetical protein